MLLPEVFDAALIADQLRCSGVIEAVRVSRLGYPQRYSHSMFISRYRVLGLKVLSKKKTADKKYNPVKALVHAITKHVVKGTGDKGQDNDSCVQVGKTKIFLRRHYYNILEKLRVDKIASSAVCIQTFARQLVYKRRYLRACSSIRRLQCFIRRVRAQRIVTNMRRQHSSLIIQRTWRKYRAVTDFLLAKLVAIWVQVHYRGGVGRAKYKRLNQQRRALQIQTLGRRYIAMKRYKKVIDSVVLIQCARRSYLSRLLLSLKKAEARDFNALVQERDRLRTELSALKVELQKAKEDANMHVEAPSKELVARLIEKDKEIDSLRLAMDRLSAKQDTQDRELMESKESVFILTAERDAGLCRIKELELLNAELYQQINGLSVIAANDVRHLSRDIEDANNGNGQVLGEMNELKLMNQALQSENNEMYDVMLMHNENTLLNAPSSPALAKFECALQRALARISQLEEDNQKLTATNASLHNERVISRLESIDDHNEIDKKLAAPTRSHKNNTTNANNYTPILPPASVYTTVTTDNMTADTEEEILKLREENQVLQKQLELLRCNQGVLPDIVGSDQDYDESVNPSDSGVDDEDNGSGFVRYVFRLIMIVNCSLSCA